MRTEYLRYEHKVNTRFFKYLKLFKLYFEIHVELLLFVFGALTAMSLAPTYYMIFIII